MHRQVAVLTGRVQNERDEIFFKATKQQCGEQGKRRAKYPSVLQL